MAASIRAGLADLPAGSSGALFLPCDQPTLSVDLLKAFLRAHGASPGATLASAYGRGIGIPALFPAARLPELEGLSGDRGARSLLGDAEQIPFAGGEVDLDTPEDVQALGSRANTLLEGLDAPPGGSLSGLLHCSEMGNRPLA